MERGDVMELAMWCWDGGDTEEYGREIIELAMDRVFTDEGWARSPVRYEKVDAGHPRLQTPPENIRDKNPYCVVGEAEAVAPVTFKDMSDVWESKSLERLRRAVRAQWYDYSGGETLSDMACDAVIEDLGADTVRKILN